MQGKSLAEHAAEPDVSIIAHIAAKRHALRSGLEDKVAIYLDTRFWIMVREVRDGTSKRADERAIVGLLDKLVHTGRAFCPIAEPTLLELMKQGNVEQRQRTAAAIDDLSLGTAILPDTERLTEEAADLLRVRAKTGKVAEFVPFWTRLPYILGETYPANTAFPPAQERAIQKAFFDHMWERSIVEMVDMLDGDEYSQSEERARAAEELNASNAKHAHAMGSFAKVLEQEYHGVAQTIVERSPDLIRLFTPGGAEAPKECDFMLVNGLREMLKRPVDAQLMPTAHVHAVIHALFRWEYRSKPMTPNDLIDFRHAAAALSHCPILLTEAGLCKTLTHRRMSLAAVHGTIVMSDREEIAAYLARLDSETSAKAKEHEFRA